MYVYGTVFSTCYEKLSRKWYTEIQFGEKSLDDLEKHFASVFT